MQSRGRYELLRCLGRGGMAEVFLARFRGPHGFERVVVVKRVLPQLAKEAVFVQRLIDEARVAARLHHENIVQVLELGDDHGMPFLALELVEGRDLFVILDQVRAQKERMPVPHVVTVVRGVLAALAHAHAQGVVHRDVSSSNVIVSYQGGVKLIDFGIARARDSLSLTRPGAVLGKAMYMSPEQQRGTGTVDGRADVYAAGVLLHLMLANEGPAPSSSGALRVSDAVPESLRALVARAIAEEPRERFSADEMLAALDAWIERTGTSTSTTALGSWLRAFMPADASASASSDGGDDEATGTRSAVRPAEGHIDSSLASLVDAESVADDDNPASSMSATAASPYPRSLLATQETPARQAKRARNAAPVQTSEPTSEPTSEQTSRPVRDAHDEPTRILEGATPAWHLSNAPTVQVPIDDARTATTSSALATTSPSFTPPSRAPASDPLASGTSSSFAPPIAAPLSTPRAAATITVTTPTANASALPRIALAAAAVAAIAIVVVIVIPRGGAGVPPAALPPSSTEVKPNADAPPSAATVNVETSAPPLPAPTETIEPVEPVAPPRKRITRGDRRDTVKEAKEAKEASPDVTQGELSVRTTPSGARVLVDGREVGITPLRRLVAVGAHDVTLIARSGARVQLPISVRANKLSEVNMKLE